MNETKKEIQLRCNPIGKPNCPTWGRHPQFWNLWVKASLLPNLSHLEPCLDLLNTGVCFYIKHLRVSSNIASFFPPGVYGIYISD